MVQPPRRGEEGITPGEEWDVMLVRAVLEGLRPLMMMKWMQLLEILNWVSPIFRCHGQFLFPVMLLNSVTPP